MKQGANFQDVNRIKELAEKGHTAEEISLLTRVVVPVCKSWMKGIEVTGEPDPIIQEVDVLDEDGESLIEDDESLIEDDESLIEDDESLIEDDETESGGYGEILESDLDD